MHASVICPRCEEERALRDFDHPTAGRRHGYCRQCRRAYNREWYRENRRRHIAHVRANNDRYMERNRAVVEEVKDAPCSDCGERYPAVVMEFDHVRGEKHNEVSALMHSGCSVQTILDEIAKCDLVCANCHRLRTARRDWNHDI